MRENRNTISKSLDAIKKIMKTSNEKIARKLLLDEQSIEKYKAKQK